MVKQTKLDEQSIAIADAVRAEAARVGVSGKRLAQDIGRDRNYIYERFRYEKPFDTNDLSIIAKSLGISLESLFQSATFGQQIHRAFASNQERAA